MSDKTNVFSLADFKRKETNNVKYTTVEAYGGTVRLGSVSARDMLDWIAGNQDETKKRLSGARLIVKSLVDEDGTACPNPSTTPTWTRSLRRTTRRTTRWPVPCST